MRVSVLLPMRDAEATLSAALASIARQTLADFECVVVDDGSKDGSLAIARAVAARDARFRVEARAAEGLVAALEAGRALCRAPIVARMDADDLMRRERLEAQVGALEADPSLTAVGCRVRLFPRARMLEGIRHYEAWLNSLETPESVRRDAFVECPIAHPALAIRREALSYRERGWPEDYDLVLRLLAGGARIAVLPRRLLSWRDGPARLSRTSPAYSLERFAACKAEFLAQGFLAGAAEYHLWGFGSTGKLLRAALLAHGKRPSHIFDLKPQRLGNVIDGAPVVPAEALASLPKRPIVVCIAGLDSRAAARADLEARGLVELADYVCAS